MSVPSWGIFPISGSKDLFAFHVIIIALSARSGGKLLGYSSGYSLLIYVDLPIRKALAVFRKSNIEGYDTRV